MSYFSYMKSIRRRVVFLLASASVAAPAIAFAQYPPGGSGDDIGSVAQTILNTINQVLVPLLFAIAFIVFLYGVFRYFILGGADEAQRESGRQFILWGLIGFVVMISLWGLVNVIANTFGFGNTLEQQLPQTPPAPNGQNGQ
jgi:membrane protease YdiL (CAAX protease family)